MLPNLFYVYFDDGKVNKVRWNNLNKWTWLILAKDRTNAMESSVTVYYFYKITYGENNFFQFSKSLPVEKGN